MSPIDAIPGQAAGRPMNIAVLGATGATGRLLVSQALERGHLVTAIVRDPARLELSGSERLQPAIADVSDPASIARAVQGADVVLSGLGVVKGGRSDTLTLGARALIEAAPARIIWLGAFGTGESAQTAGAITRAILKAALGAEVPDKVGADAIVLRGGATVFHSGPLKNGPLSVDRRVVPLADLPRRLIPKYINRATVAACMLDEAEAHRFPGQVVVPLAGS